MSTTFTAQHVAFVFPPGTAISEATIMSDSGVAAAAGFSLGNDVQVQYRPYYNYTSGESKQAALVLIFIVSAANAASIVSGIPALVTRMATAQPQITHIYTWGETWAWN